MLFYKTFHFCHLLPFAKVELSQSIPVVCLQFEIEFVLI